MARKTYHAENESGDSVLVIGDTAITMTSPTGREFHAQVEDDGRLIVSINGVGIRLSLAELQHLKDLLE